MYQQKFWVQLVSLKVDVDYYYSYAQKNEMMDNRVGIFMAIASSTSIASWAIWQSLSFVWGSIIAGSQLIGAVKQYIFYKKRADLAYRLYDEYRSLLIETERNWFAVSNGTLTESEIVDKSTELSSKISEINRSILHRTSLPLDRKTFSESEISAQRYFANHYNTGA